MGVRGRKSAASLAVSAAKLPGERPAPPVALVDEEREVWRAVVNAMPSHWVTPENYELLAAYARHVVRARWLDVVIKGLMAKGEWSAEVKDALMAAKTESATIMNLSRSMRLSQASRANQARAETAVKHAHAGTLPWERAAA